MTVNIIINPGEEAAITEPTKPQPPTLTKAKVKVRKALDGRLIVTDHPDIDIVILAKQMKIISFAKESMEDSIYATQNRLFDFLYRKGIIGQESVKGGNVYSSLEATILTPNSELPIDETVLFAISKFIEEERPQFMYEKAIEEQEEERLLEPEVEDSTELGEIPHAAKKGSISPSPRRYMGGGIGGP